MSHKTGADMVAQARAKVREVTVAEMLQAIDKPGAPTFLDVRERAETNLGRIPGAIVLARGSMETKIEALVPRDAKLVIYCASGNRSAFAAVTLAEMGYTDVASLKEGFNGWAASGGEVEG